MKKLILILLLALIPCRAFAAATYDNIGSATTLLTDTCSTNPTTFSVTQTNSNEPGVVVFVTYTPIVGLVTDDGNPAPSSVTADGNNMSFVGAVYNVTHTTEAYVYRGLTGTYNIQVNWADIDDFCVVTAYTRAITMYNVAQSGTYAYNATNSGSGTSASTNITTHDANNIIVDGMEAHNGYSTISVTGSNQTQKFNAQVGGKGGYMRVGNSIKQATGGTDNLAWSINISRPWGHNLVEIVGTSGATTNHLLGTLGMGT